jgi:hypothetical protein
MKVILSRKGFDSAFGGYPSPILSSGKMVSLPIPLEDSIRYSDLRMEGSTYYDLMAELRPTIKRTGKRLHLNKETRCHLDPDIHKESIERESGWKPCFGQIDSAQNHLENQYVSSGDLFLFFGWFRRTRYHSGKLKFDAHEKGLHAIFGYLQIGEIKKVDHEFYAPKWLAYHPHNNEKRRSNKTNTIYIARDNLSWNSSLPGAGRFMFNDKLVLTKKGLSRSKWNLPDCFREADISYHNKDSWKEGYFQSAAIGQEFVITYNEEIEEWAKSIIEGSQIDSSNR